MTKNIGPGVKLEQSYICVYIFTFYFSISSVLHLISFQKYNFLFQFSWVDIVGASFFELISNICELPDIISDYPNLQALQEKVFNLPQIKKWIEKRPKVPY